MQGKQQWKVPVKTVFQFGRAPAHRVVGPDVDHPAVARGVVEAGQEATVGSAVHHVRVLRVGHDVAAFAARRGFPVPFADRAAQGRARPDAHGGVVLLAAQQAEREVIVQGDAVHLRGGLVRLGRPVLAAVVAHVGAAVVGLDHSLRVVRVDPQVVVVAVGCCDRFEGLAAVLRAMEAHVQHVHGVLVGRVGVDPGVVPGALPQFALLVDALPGFAAVAGAEHAALFGFDDGVQVVRVRR